MVSTVQNHMPQHTKTHKSLHFRLDINDTDNFSPWACIIYHVAQQRCSSGSRCLVPAGPETLLNTTSSKPFYRRAQHSPRSEHTLPALAQAVAAIYCRRHGTLRSHNIRLTRTTSRDNSLRLRITMSVNGGPTHKCYSL
jgi:hypothetical protein